MVELICINCKIKFQRSLKEHIRSIKLNRKEFCSNSCGTEYYSRQGLYDKAHIKALPLLRKYNKINSRKVDKLSCIRKYYLSIVSRSKRKNWKLILSLQDLKDIWDKQNGKCYYTGINLKLPKNSSGFKNLVSPWKTSVERLDSSKQYTKDNVVFCCFMANVCKNRFSKEEMFEFCKLIINYNKLNSPLIPPVS